MHLVQSLWGIWRASSRSSRLKPFQGKCRIASLTSYLVAFKLVCHLRPATPDHASSFPMFTTKSRLRPVNSYCKNLCVFVLPRSLLQAVHACRRFRKCKCRQKGYADVLLRNLVKYQVMLEGVKSGIQSILRNEKWHTIGNCEGWYSAAAIWVAKARCEVGAMCVPEVSRPANCLCSSAGVLAAFGSCG